MQTAINDGKEKTVEVCALELFNERCTTESGNVRCPLVVYRYGECANEWSHVKEEAPLCGFNFDIGRLPPVVPVGYAGTVHTKMWVAEGDMAELPANLFAMLFVNFDGNPHSASRFIDADVAYKFVTSTSMLISLPKECGGFTLNAHFDDYCVCAIYWNLYGCSVDLSKSASEIQRADIPYSEKLIGGAYDHTEIENMAIS